MDERKPIEPKQQSWEGALRDKLDSFDYPIGELPPLVLPTGVNRKGRFAPWWIVAISAAASICFALFFPQKPEVVMSPCTATEVAISAQSPNEEGQIEHASLVASNIDVHETTVRETTVEDMTDVNKAVVVTDDVATERSEKTTEKSEVRVSRKPEVRDNGKVCTKGSSAPIYTTRQIGNASNRGVVIAFCVSGQAMRSSRNEPEPLLTSLSREIDQLSSGKQSYSVREKLPIEVGVTAIVPITSRLSVESGLRYALRRFEVTSSGLFMPEQYEMDVRQIGVPIGLQYEPVRKGNVGLNLSAGVSGNLPVAVALRGNYQEAQKARFFLDSYATLGVDYNITRAISLGVSVGGAYDIIPMNNQLFEDSSSRLRLKMNVGLKFRIQ